MYLSRKLGRNERILNQIGKDLGFKEMEDWYKITKSSIRMKGGNALLGRYGDSPSKLILSTFRHHKWLLWKFDNVPQKFWTDPRNHLLFLDWLGVQLGFKGKEDWYRLTRKNLEENGGRSLLVKFGGSISKMISSTYWNHDWNLALFETKDTKNHNRKIELMERLAIKLGFQKMEDWYNVKSEDIILHGGIGMLLKYDGHASKMVMATYPQHLWDTNRFIQDSFLEASRGLQVGIWLAEELKIHSPEEWYRISWSQIHERIPPAFFKKNPLEEILQQVYPQHSWNIPKLQAKNLGTIKASQRILTKIVMEIFPGSEVIEEYHGEEFNLVDMFWKFELDVYLPKELLAFEYQGEQHYFDIYHMGTLWIQQQRDQEKKRACQEKGIILVEVPYWWNFTKSSLVATVHQSAPHLISSPGDGVPISKNPTKPILNAFVPELMNGEEWDGIDDLSGWWITEKMDGVRAYWNGEKLISRNGKNIICPTWFSSSLPKELKLDGELWMGRRQFEKTMAVLNSKGSDRFWKDIKYVIFDALVPNNPYEKRMDDLTKLQLPSFASIVNVRLCVGNQSLIQELNEVVRDGGEGLVCTKPKSLYLPHRTRTRLKVKLYSDSEVQLLEILPTGFYCLQINGIESIVGSDRCDFDKSPKIGSILTVKHSGTFNNGTVRHAFFWRQRSDILWEAISNHSRYLFLHADWTVIENRRKFFDYLKVQLGSNSYSDMYRITSKDIEYYGAKALLEHIFDGSMRAAFDSVYPHHNWLAWKFNENVADAFWNQGDNQKLFMDWLAKELGYLEMKDWYKITMDIICENGGRTLMNLYSGSTTKLITNIYPDHDWVMWKFETVPKGFWNIRENAKRFLDWLGNQIQYTHLEDWYSIDGKTIEDHGGRTLLGKYENSPGKLVTEIYSNHVWTIQRFEVLSKKNRAKQDFGDCFTKRITSGLSNFAKM